MPAGLVRLQSAVEIDYESCSGHCGVDAINRFSQRNSTCALIGPIDHAIRGSH